MDIGQDLQASALKAKSDEDVDASLSRYYEAIANFDEPGKKKEASTTLTLPSMRAGRMF